MKTAKIGDKFNRSRSHENWCNIKLQKNCSVKLLRETKAQHYGNLSVKKVKDKQTLWKTVKPYFRDTESNSNQITLLEND